MLFSLDGKASIEGIREDLSMFIYDDELAPGLTEC